MECADEFSAAGSIGERHQHRYIQRRSAPDAIQAFSPLPASGRTPKSCLPLASHCQGAVRFPVQKRDFVISDLWPTLDVAPDQITDYGELALALALVDAHEYPVEQVPHGKATGLRDGFQHA